MIVAEEYPDDLDPSRSRLLRVVDGALSEPPLELPGPVDGVIATEGGWLVSGHAPVGFVADERGVLATFETTASRVTPRASRGGDVWLRTTEAGAVFLELFREGALVDRSPEATTVQGPVRVGDRWLALIDGALYAHDDTWRPLEEVPWTCLRAYGGTTSRAASRRSTSSATAARPCR